MRKFCPGLVAAFVLLASVGCDQTFDPFGEADQHLSVFGFLNASADTQWVRVMPIRETLVSSEDLLGATVTLEDPRTSSIITLKPSLRRFQDPFLGDSTFVTVQNYWTTAPILPGSQYRFTATLPDGTAATANVSIPREISTVVVGIRKDQVNGYVRFSGVPHLALLRVVHDSSFQVVQPVPATTGDAHHIDVTKAVDCRFVSCPTDVEVEIVASGEEWPRGNRFSSSALNVTDLPSNVTNAVGFLGGVITKRVPFESCTFEPEGSPSSICELTYNAATATLEGVVLDRSCGSKPLTGAAVRLREAQASQTGFRKVRPATTDSKGYFRISGLDPGTPYALSITHQMPSPEGALIWTPHTETRTFRAGERTKIEVGLTRKC